MMTSSPKRELTAVVAVDRRWCIGKHGQIPWRLSEDLKQFKRLTTGHVIIMGRKTYESIGRALPNRRNIVLTRQRDYEAPGCDVYHDIDAVLAEVDAESRHGFVIGGSAIYEVLMPWTTRCVLTVVDVTIEGGDAHLPALSAEGWRSVATRSHAADERNDHDFVVHDLERVVGAPWQGMRGESVPEAWRVSE